MNTRALTATAVAIMALLAVMLIALPDGSAPPQGSSQKPIVTRGQREVERAIAVGYGAEYEHLTCLDDGEYEYKYDCTGSMTCYLDEDRPLPQDGGNASYITCFNGDPNSMTGPVDIRCVIDTGAFMSLRDPGGGSCVP